MSLSYSPNIWENTNQTWLSSRYRLFSRNSKFSNYRVFLSKYLVFQIQCAKNLLSQTFFIWNTGFFDPNTRFSIEILGFSFVILSFSLEILGITKICDNHIQYTFPKILRIWLQSCMNLDFIRLANGSRYSRMDQIKFVEDSL